MEINWSILLDLLLSDHHGLEQLVPLVLGVALEQIYHGDLFYAIFFSSSLGSK